LKESKFYEYFESGLKKDENGREYKLLNFCRFYEYKEKKKNNNMLAKLIFVFLLIAHGKLEFFLKKKGKKVLK
jgi:hypothetical protein